MIIGPEYQQCADGQFRKVAEFANGPARRQSFVTVVLVRNESGILIKAECGPEARRQIQKHQLQK